jgi:SPP1 gp7 family putative phage head morphogenesis protein
MKKPPTLLASLNYRRWIAERDRGLERIHFRAQVEVTLLLNRFIEHAISFGSHALHTLQGNQFTLQGRKTLELYDQRLRQEASYILPAILGSYVKMRRKSQALAYLGEAEGIARSLKGKVGKIRKPERRDFGDSFYGGVPILGLAERALDRLRNHFYDALNTSRVMEETVSEGLDRLNRQVPEVRAYQSAQKVLQRPKFREAKGDQKPGFQWTIPEEWDPQLWQEVVEDYLGKWVPPYRKPSDVFDIPEEGYPANATEIYGWEFEQQMTQDFVDEVRNAMRDAGSAVGIQDFVWIAVIDDRTDECCLKRDGLLLSEIADKMKSEWKDDDCDAESPPAHFNCRCSIAPVQTDDVPPDEGVTTEDFAAWLRDGVGPR